MSGMEENATKAVVWQGERTLEMGTGEDASLEAPTAVLLLLTSTAREKASLLWRSRDHLPFDETPWKEDERGGSLSLSSM